MAGLTTHQELTNWVDGWAEVFQPDAVVWCDGSQEEADRLCELLGDAGTFTRLAEGKRPHSYLALSAPSEVARVEDRTFIASAEEIDAGPTNHWRQPDELKAEMREL